MKNFRHIAAGLFLGATAVAMAQPTPQQLVIGEAYPASAFTWVSDITNPVFGGRPGTCMEFTATTAGKLTIVQAGTDASHVYNAQWNPDQVWDDTYGTGATYWSPYYHIVEPDRGPVPGATSPYTYDYTLVGGQTVYIYGKTESADPFSINSTAWTPLETEYPAAIVGTPFTAYSAEGIYQYTSPVSGVMTVAQSTDAVTASNTVTFLYTNPSLSPASRVYPDNITLGAGNTWKFTVTAGTTYYFSQSQDPALTFTIMSVEEQTVPTVTITGTYPEAGTSALSDEATWVGGARFTLTPQSGVAIGNAVFEYISGVTGEPVTIPLKTPVRVGDAWTIDLSAAYGEAMRNAKGYTLVKVVLTDITLNGQAPMTEKDVPASYTNYIICEEGKITVEYLVTAPLSIVKATLPENIYKSWTPDDPAAQVDIIFNNPIASLGEVTLMMGEHYYGGISGEVPDPSFDLNDFTEVNGAVVSINLSGINITALPKTYTECTLMIQGIRDIYDNVYLDNGQPALTYYIDYLDMAAPEPAETMDKGIVLSPADGNGYAIDLENFKVRFPDQNLSLVDDQTTIDVYLDGEVIGQAPVSLEKGQMIETAPDVFEQFNETLVIDLTGFDAYGSYLVMLPQGLVENESGAVNPAMPLTCTSLVGNGEGVVTPGEGEVKNLETITVSYPSGATLGFNESAGAITWFGRPIPAGSLSTAGNELIITMGEMEKGEYTLVIPETYLVISGNSLNEEISVTYIVVEGAGVEAFEMENGVYPVYNLKGLKVGESLQGLAPGIYIVNGKKVLVK